MEEKIKLFINSQQETLSAQTLSDLMQLKRLSSKPGMAIALNQKVIPQSDWEKTKLKNNDKILIITATQGG